MEIIESDITKMGNTYLIDNTEIALILNSRQSKTPCGLDEWVQSTILAVQHAIDNNRTIITSTGMNTWELVLWATHEFGGKSIVVLPKDGKQDYVEHADCLMRDYGINSPDCAFIYFKPKISRGNKSWWTERDRFIYQMAYEIIPISLREGSNWGSMLESELSDNKLINTNYRVEYSPRSKSAKYLAFEIPPVGISNDWDYIAHWTRRFYEPWPGESSYAFYNAIYKSKIHYPRTAADSLKHIIESGVLKGSDIHIKTGKNAVSFTSLPPHEAVKLMKWRSRYVRYTFEPYGIAIKEEAARAAGIVPVTYVNKSEKLDRQSEENLDEMTQGYGKAAWYREKEWRFIGDLDLTALNPDDVKIIIPRTSDTEMFDFLSPWNVLALDAIGTKSVIA